MSAIINLLVFVMVLLSSNAYFQLLRDGGAREQGLTMALNNESFIDQLPKIWGVAVMLVVAALLLTKRMRKSPPEWSFFVLIAICVASAAWSEYPADAVKIGLLIGCAYLLVHTQIMICGPANSLAFLCKVLLAINLSSLFFIFFFPSYGISIGEHSGEWQGVFDHKNGLGNFSVLAFVVAMWQYRDRRTWVGRAAILTSVVLVVGSRSTTATVNLALAGILFAVMMRKQLVKLLIDYRYLVFAIFLGTLGLQLYVSLVDPDTPLLFLSGDSSFTGRTAIWLVALQSAVEAPYLGHGVGQFSRMSLDQGGGDLQASLGFIVGSTHNGFIEVFYSLGSLGVALLLFLIGKKIRDSKSDRTIRFYFIFVTMLLSLNFTESRLIGFNIFLISFMYLTYFAEPRRARVATPESRMLPQSSI